MNPAVVLALVLLATYAVLALGLSALAVLAWQAGLERARATSLDFLAVRLLPSAGALLIALTVVLPAFLAFEPRHEQEAAGPWLWLLAMLAGAALVGGICRGWRAVRAARALLRCCGADPHGAGTGPAVHVVDCAEPLVAVIGAWRPRIVASESVRAACSGEEFRAVLAHEAAHVAARDNLKLLLAIAAPDPLALTPLASRLTERWRTVAECEADQRATGGDDERRLALASALIKVARLRGCTRRGAALAMPVAADDVPGRVRALLELPPRPMRARVFLALAGGALLLPLLALPCYAQLHELIEQLVHLGR